MGTSQEQVTPAIELSQLVLNRCLFSVLALQRLKSWSMRIEPMIDFILTCLIASIYVRRDLVGSYVAIARFVPVEVCDV